jgi:oligopeptide/dipeptide ABC transporter ATP-binding protein
MSSQFILEVQNLSISFPPRRIMGIATGESVVAVRHVSFAVKRGEIFGLAGESGSGKSTTALAIVGWYRPTAGRILVDGTDVRDLHGGALKALRRRVQMIFQDPYASLNPRFTVRQTLEEPMIAHGIPASERQRRIREMLAYVELRPVDEYLRKYPHQLSGGQRQRAGIARALTLEPDLLIADEPVSMLDVSLRAGVLSLFERLNRDFEMSIVHISHDLAVLRHTCSFVAVMFAGKLVELGPADAVATRPIHPYTQALVTAAEFPLRDESRMLEANEGLDPPALSGCPYRSRCLRATAECARVEPELVSIESPHAAACVLASEASVMSAVGSPSSA